MPEKAGRNRTAILLYYCRFGHSRRSIADNQDHEMPRGRCQPRIRGAETFRRSRVPAAPDVVTPACPGQLRLGGSDVAIAHSRCRSCFKARVNVGIPDLHLHDLRATPATPSPPKPARRCARKWVGCGRHHMTPTRVTSHSRRGRPVDCARTPTLSRPATWRSATVKTSASARTSSAIRSLHPTHFLAALLVAVIESRCPEGIAERGAQPPSARPARRGRSRTLHVWATAIIALTLADLGERLHAAGTGESFEAAGLSVHTSADSTR